MSDETAAESLIEQVRSMLREGRVDEPHDEGVAASVRAVIHALLELARQYEWSEEGILTWLNGQTTYFDGRRPIDLLNSDPDAVLRAARADWGIEW